MCVTFELTYNAPEGWQRKVMDFDGRDDERRLLLGDRMSETESLFSGSPKSRHASRLSIASRGSQALKSPTNA